MPEGRVELKLEVVQFGDGEKEYIKNQLEEDFAEDQISLKEYMDPFTGVKNK